MIVKAATAEQYQSAADEVVKRITALVPEHPEIFTMDDPWELLKVPGFDVSDIGPSLFQVGWALRRVQHLNRLAAPGAPDV